MSLNFNGSNNQVKIASDSSLNFTNTISICILVNYVSTKECYLLEKKSDKYDLLQYAAFSGKLSFYCTCASGSVFLTTLNAQNTGTWKFIVCTYDKDAGANNAKIYSNGVLDNQGTFNVGAITINNDILSLGAGWGGSYAFPGYIGLLRLYNRVLSATEILTIYNSQYSDNILNGCALYFRLLDKPNATNSDNSADEVRDISGNENHGTCYNTPIFYAAPIKLHSRR